MKVSEHFDSSKLNCHHCDQAGAKPELIANLENVRAVVGMPVPRRHDALHRTVAHHGGSVDRPYAVMHDKFMVADGMTVETGCLSFNAAAEQKNAENVLVLHDPAVAQRYGQEWERLWAESEDLKPRY